MRLTREAILESKDIKTEEVAVPEWGGEVLVRGLTGRERDEFESAIMQRRGKHLVPDVFNVRARLVTWCVIDEDGNHLFEPGDITTLGEKNGAAINRIFEVASKLSGMTDEDVEDLVENFGAANGSASHSSSPENSTSRGQGSSPKRTATN